MNAQIMKDYQSFFDSKPAFNALVEHWAKARIDIPMQVVARFDDAAKQLITLGSLLQGLYIAAFTFGDLKHQIPVWLLWLLFIPLIALIFCAAQAICIVPLKKEAFDTYNLFRSNSGLSDETLTSAVDSWCQTIDGIADQKHKWLKGAKFFLIINSAATLGLLLTLMYMRK